MKHASAVLGAFAVLILSSGADAAVYNFADTTFANADWIGTKHVDTSPGAVSTFAAFQLSPGGSPILPGPATPDYRTIRHAYGTGGSAIAVTHRDVLWNWSPLPLETATTVDYSYDLKFFDGPTGAVGFKPTIFQGGSVFVRTVSDDVFGPTPPAAPFPFGWQRFGTTGVPLAVFQELDPVTGLLLPNTPSPIAAMSFGFTSSNSASGQATKIAGIDDFRFTLNTVIAPEPTTLAGLAATTLILRRRR